MRKRQEDYAKLWELNPIWNSLTAEEKLRISDLIELVSYKKNEQVHTEGEPADSIWVLLSGKIRIYKEGIGQRAQIIRLLKPYDMFGYRACIASDCYTSCASALEPSVAYRLSREDFMDLIHENPAFCQQVLLMMASDLALSELQTVNLTQKHIRGRLAESLLQLKKNYGVDDDGFTLSMYMSREDLANMSNMTTSNAIRTLSQFASEGLISVDGRKVRLLNEAELAHISRMG